MEPDATPRRPHAGSSGSSSNDYWKMKYPSTVKEAREFLKSQGHRVRSDSNKRSIMDAVARCQRHSLPFNNCSSQELLTFCAARCLRPSGSAFRTLATTLEKADDEATFDKLLKLPQEMRDWIYEYYMIGLGDVPARHHQPPLTLVSKQLRKEALPFFYGQSLFRLRCGVGGRVDSDTGSLTYSVEGDLGMITDPDLPDANLVRVKHLQFTVKERSTESLVNIFLNYSPRIQHDRTVLVVNGAHIDGVAPLDTKLSQIRSILLGLFHRKKSEEGGLVLKRDDFALVAQAVIMGLLQGN